MPVTFDSVSPSGSEATLDVRFTPTGLVIAVEIERRIPAASRDDARAMGVPEEEVTSTYTVTKNHPVRSGRNTWRDYQVRHDVDYSYRVRSTLEPNGWTHTDSEAWGGA